jgi:hypothetical protein
MYRSYKMVTALLKHACRLWSVLLLLLLLLLLSAQGSSEPVAPRIYLFIYFIIISVVVVIIIIISCHTFSLFLDTSPLEPVVNPTTQASSLSLLLLLLWNKSNILRDSILQCVSRCCWKYHSYMINIPMLLNHGCLRQEIWGPFLQNFT